MRRSLIFKNYNKPRDKVSQGGVRQQASIPVVLACCVSLPNRGRRSINLRRRFTVKLTTQELEQMRSVDIGAVAAESLPDVSGMTFDNALSRKERISRFLQTIKNPYCFCIGGVGVKIEFAESGPSLQDMSKTRRTRTICWWIRKPPTWYGASSKWRRVVQKHGR